MNKKIHIDLDFEGKRLVDDVEIIEEINKKEIMVYSPKLRSNIIINKFKEDQTNGKQTERKQM